MEHRLFGIAAIIASMAFLISSIGDSFAFPQGPNVSLGSNPIVTIDCGSNGASYPSNEYQVPAGYDLLITDIISPNHTVTIYRNGSGWMRLVETKSLATGILIASGDLIKCTNQSTSGVPYAAISGHLARQ